MARGDPVLKLVNELAVIVGVEWDQSTDTWTRIDLDGNPILGFPISFDQIYPWSDIRRVTLNTNGSLSEWGIDGKGTGITLDGSAGRVMKRIPLCYLKVAVPSANKYRYWISPIPLPGFVDFPFRQRVGPNKVADAIYLGAYEAGISYASPTSITKVLQSQTGVQPYTGNADCIWEVDFDAGANEPVIGDSLSTPTEGGFLLVDCTVTSGSWAANTAAGKLLIRKPGDSTCGWVNDETITNTTRANTLGLVNVNVIGELANIGTCRTYASNIGLGWGLMNIWSLALEKILYYIEYANADSQSTIGRGIVNKAGGIGFNGELTGADGIDTNLSSNGTGTGTGTNGLTPIAYRGLENPWGNIWKFIEGYNALDAGYRIIKRDGSGVFADTLADGNYEVSAAAPITVDGYINNIESEELLKYHFIPLSVAGSSTTYLHDHFWAHDVGETNILLAGGDWTNGVMAGVACLSSNCVASFRARHVGARLEFIG